MNSGATGLLWTAGVFDRRVVVRVPVAVSLAAILRGHLQPTATDKATLASPPFLVPTTRRDLRHDAERMHVVPAPGPAPAPRRYGVPVRLLA